MAAEDCDNPVTCLASGAGDLINSVSSTVGYWSDPWGNTFKALQDAATGMANDLMPTLTEATLPDLNMDWFIQAYKISFAAAILAGAFLLIPQAVRTARGTMSGRDLAESVGLYFPMFLLGAMFGPAFGILLVKFFHSLSDAFTNWGITGSIDKTVETFQNMITNADPVGIAGGVPIAVLLMFFMVVGLFLVLAVLVVQLVTLYFTGVLVPLALVWIIDPTKRQFGLRLVGIWVGILAAHPLLLFLLGFAFSMMAGSVDTFGNNASIQDTVQLLVAIISIFIAAFSPLALMKFAPLLPVGMGGSSGPSISPGSWGPNNISDATAKYQPSSSSTAPSGRSQYAASSNAEDDGAVQGSAGLGDTAGRQSGTSRLAAHTGSATAAPSVGSAAGTATEGAVAAEAAEGLAVAGTAETATEVGSVIGIPTLLAAGAVVGVGKVSDLAQAAGIQAADAMTDGEGV